MSDAAAFVTGLDDTIVALATPRGGGVRGVIRISGDDAMAITAACSDVSDELRSVRFGAVTGRLQLDDTGAAVPATFWVMRGPRSYTAEDSVEIHTIGSTALCELILERLRARGARIARPGEFTRRAFLNGRIDLTRAEAVAATVHARTESEHRAALAVLDGAVARRVDRLADAIQAVITPLELDLDFSDQDIDIIDSTDAAESIREVIAAVDALLSDRAAAVRASGRRRVLLAGPTNAGKSSLFNALVGAGRAIVSPVAGTTRDYLEAELTLGDVEIVLVDTAGDDHAGGAADAAAHSLRGREAERADLVVQVRDGRRAGGEIGEGGPTVFTHADLVPGRDGPGTWVSSATGEGLDALREDLRRVLTADEKGAPQSFVHLQQRHRACYERARAALSRGADAAAEGWGVELVAADLTDALAALAEITGADYTDAVLDRIFGEFCIGK